MINNNLSTYAFSWQVPILLPALMEVKAPAGLDSLLVSVLSGEEEQLKKRGRKKKGACDGQGISLGMLNFDLKKKQWLASRS